jgi:hypothetical protein
MHVSREFRDLTIQVPSILLRKRNRCEAMTIKYIDRSGHVSYTDSLRPPKVWEIAQQREYR